MRGRVYPFRSSPLFMIAILQENVVAPPSSY